MMRRMSKLSYEFIICLTYNIDIVLRFYFSSLPNEDQETSNSRTTFESTTQNLSQYNEFKSKMPEFEQILDFEANEFDCEGEWYNSEPLFFEESLKGKLVLLDFWTS